MVGYHILLVKLKILYKKYNLLGLQQWWLKSEIISEGLVNQAAEGKHYSRAMRFHEQSLEYLYLLRLKVRENNSQFTCGCNEPSWHSDVVTTLSQRRC